MSMSECEQVREKFELFIEVKWCYTGPPRLNFIDLHKPRRIRSLIFSYTISKIHQQGLITRRMEKNY